MIITGYAYDYEIICNTVCKHFDDTIGKLFKINDCIFYYLYNAWCRIRCNTQNVKNTIINNVITDIFVANPNFIAINIYFVIIYRYCIVDQSLQLIKYKIKNSWIYICYILKNKQQSINIIVINIDVASVDSLRIMIGDNCSNNFVLVFLSLSNKGSIITMLGFKILALSIYPHKPYTCKKLI